MKILSRKFIYCIVGKFGESFMSRQTKPSKLVLTINNLLADLFICQTFFRQMLKKSLNFSPAKLSHYIYGI